MESHARSEGGDLDEVGHLFFDVLMDRSQRFEEGQLKNTAFGPQCDEDGNISTKDIAESRIAGWRGQRPKSGRRK